MQLCIVGASIAGRALGFVVVVADIRLAIGAMALGKLGEEIGSGQICGGGREGG
jgi:hypothetical protein